MMYDEKCNGYVCLSMSLTGTNFMELSVRHNGKYRKMIQKKQTNVSS